MTTARLHNATTITLHSHPHCHIWPRFHAVRYPRYILLQPNSLGGPGKGALCTPGIWFLNSSLSDIHLPTFTWYTPYIKGVQAYFPWVVFFTVRWWVFMSLSKQPAAYLVWGCMLVGKHGYTCGFFSLVSLFISGIPGMTDILVTVAIWCYSALQCK